MCFFQRRQGTFLQLFYSSLYAMRGPALSMSKVSVILAYAACLYVMLFCSDPFRRFRVLQLEPSPESTTGGPKESNVLITTESSAPADGVVPVPGSPSTTTATSLEPPLPVASASSEKMMFLPSLRPHQQRIIKASLVGGLAVAAFRMVPRLRRVLRRGAPRKKSSSNLQQESFAKMLNLTKTELAGAVHTGKMFNQTLEELEDTLPILEDSVKACIWMIGNWTTTPEMGPVSTPIAKSHGTIDQFMFLREFTTRRLKATASSLEQIVNVARSLGMNGLPVDAQAALSELENVEKMIDNAGEEVIGTSVREQLADFLTGILHEMNAVAKQTKQGAKGASIPWERLVQHIVTTKVLATQRMQNALLYLEKIREVQQTLQEHVGLKEAWTVDVAMRHSPIETRDYSVSQLSGVAEHVACVKRGVLDGPPGPHWFTAGLAQIERINYYEGQCYMNLMGAFTNIEHLGKAIQFLELFEGKNVQAWVKEYKQLAEMVTGAAGTIGNMAARNHKRCVISMEVLMAGAKNGTEVQRGELASWFQESASQRLVTSDEDAQRFFEAASNVMQSWPDANKEIQRLSKAYPKPYGRPS
eukprot:jgi/Bigna1/80091/fgenesh1_pg.67_\